MKLNRCHPDGWLIVDREGFVHYAAILLFAVVWLLSFFYLVYLPLFQPSAMNAYLLAGLLAIVCAPVVRYFVQEKVDVLIHALADRIAGRPSEDQGDLEAPKPGFDDAYEKLIEIAEREFPELALYLRQIRVFGDQDDEMSALVEVLEAGIESRSSVDLEQLLDFLEEEIAQRDYRDSTNRERMDVVRFDRDDLIVEVPDHAELPIKGVEFDIYADFVGREGRGEKHNGVVARGECVGHRGQEEYAVGINEWIEELGDDTMGIKAKLRDRDAEVKVSDPRYKNDDWRRSDNLEDALLLLKKISSQQETLL